MAVHEDTISGEKVVRGFGWFFSGYFFLAFINDWLILKGIGVIPIIDAMEYIQVDPSAGAGENAVAILIHAVGAVGIAYFLLRKKKARPEDLEPH